MRSEPSIPPAKHLAWLRSQGLGVVCGLLSALLLGIGSVVMAATADSSSAALRLDTVRPFFEKPALPHFWFYLLLPVMTLWALNALLCTWDQVLARWRAGIRAVSAYGAAVVHVAFLVALLAHLVGGALSAERGVVAIDETWSSLPDGRRVRVRSLQIESNPNGTLKDARAHLEVQDRGGGVHAADVGFNAPLSSGAGRDLALLVDFSQRPAGARFALGEARCSAAIGERCRLGSLTVELLRVMPGGHWGAVPASQVRLIERNKPPFTALLVPGMLEQHISGQKLRLEQLALRPVVMLRARHAPGNPLALASAILMALGALLLWRRWLPLF